MSLSKKPYETIREKINGYENVAKFYERNCDGRFQNKKGLINILNEINLELNKKQKEKYFNKLCYLQDRISKFI